MKTINIRESLIELDKRTNFKYTLTDLYEACRLDDNKRNQLVKFIDDKDVAGMSKMLSNEAGVMTENVDDDLTDEELNEWVPTHTDCPSCGDTSFDTRSGRCTKCSYRESLNEWFDDDYLFDAIEDTMHSGRFLYARWTDNHRVTPLRDYEYEVTHKVNGGKVRVKFDVSNPADTTLRFTVDGKPFVAKTHTDAQDIIINELENKNWSQFDVVLEGFKAGDTVFVKPSKKLGKVKSVNGDYVEVEVMGGNDPDRIDTYYTSDLELEDRLDERWTDAYEKFNEIANDLFPNVDAIKDSVEKAYREHEGEPDWDEAWKRWNEPADLEERLLNEGPGAVLGDLAGRAVGDAWKGVKNFAKGVKNTAKDVAKTTSAVAKSASNDWKQSKTRAKVVDAARAFKGAENVDDFKAKFNKRQGDRKLSDKARTQYYKGKSGKSIGDIQDWKFVVNGKKMTYDQFMKLPQENREYMIKNKTVKCFDLSGRETTFQDQATRLSGLKEWLLRGTRVLAEAWGWESTYNEDEWDPSDIELHKNTDWAARNYMELPVPEDSFEDDAILYGFDSEPVRVRTKFVKYIRPNSIYPPYYRPEIDPFADKGSVGAMYGGRTRGKYDIHDRHETQDLYNAMSEGYGNHSHPEENSISDVLMRVAGTCKVEFDWHGDDGIYRNPENHLIMLVFTDNSFGDGDEWFDNRYKWKRAVMAELRKLGWTLEDPVEDNDSYLYLVMQKRDLKEATAVLDRPRVSNVHTHTGSFSGIIDAHMDEINDMINANVPVSHIVHSLKNWVADAGLTRANARYAQNAIARMAKMRSAADVGMYIYNIRLKAEDDSYGSIDSQFYSKKHKYEDLNESVLNSMGTRLDESVEEEDKPFTHSQIFDELKRETANFSIGNDRGIYSFEKEVKMAEKILKKHYNDVKVTERGNDFMVEFSDPKNKKNKVNESYPEYSHYRCHRCGYEFGENEDRKMDKNNKPLCNDCYSEIFFTCDGCDKEYHSDYLTPFEEDDCDYLYCPSCLKKKKVNESKSLTESRGRFELEVWVPGSGGDDRERFIMASNNLQEIIDKAYEIDLDYDEAFYLRDMKDIYPYDLDQCYDAEELEDAIYNQWHYNPQADMRRQLGKMLLPQNESVETSKEWEHKDKEGRIGRIRQSDGKGDRKPLTRDQAKEIAKFRGHADDELYPVNESKSINEDGAALKEDVPDFVRHDKQGTVVSTNSDGATLIHHNDRGLNADVFNWSVIGSDGLPLLKTDREYYGRYGVAWSVPKEGENSWGDAVVLKCIADHFGFNDNDIVSYLSADKYTNGLAKRYQTTCGKDPYAGENIRGNHWANIDKVLDVLEQAKASNIIQPYINKGSKAREDATTIMSYGIYYNDRYWRGTNSVEEAQAIISDQVNEYGKDGSAFTIVVYYKDGHKEPVTNLTESLTEAMTYTDTNGFLGEPGETYTMSQFRRMWQDKDNDPVMSGYDSFEEWVGETISQMDAHEEEPEVAPSGRGKLSCATFTDKSGIMGEAGAKYTVNDLADYWEANRGSDPVLANYRGDWKKWLDDTIEQMEVSYDSSLFEESLTEDHADIMQRKTSGYDKCYKAVKKARTANPIDTKALNDARDHFGADLYKMCLDDVLKEMGNIEEAFEHPQNKEPHWYLCKHGIGPGALPKGVNIVDTLDDEENPNRCYVALDKVLTTDELKQFEMKEEKPPKMMNESLDFLDTVTVILDDDMWGGYSKELEHKYDWYQGQVMFEGDPRLKEIGAKPGDTILCGLAFTDKFGDDEYLDVVPIKVLTTDELNQ